jgi:hypothetical protein
MLTTKASQFLFEPMEGNDVDDHPTQVPVVKLEVCPIAIKFCIGEIFRVFNCMCDEHAIIHGHIEQDVNFQHHQASS